ncbi:MAG TPA: hypothetical protein VNV88_06975 [Candidatus Solibacter sp.]|jgi:hypothetical protein|nr:hypothetical protein [Candidatus Solibacter sp.]
MTLQPIRTDKDSRKNFFVAEISSFGELGELAPNSASFGLLVACDASKLSADLIGQVADKLYARGLSYLCTWGPDCERVHDVFDEAGVISQQFAMTTWHDDEPLEEAAWFFINHAVPEKVEEHAWSDWIAVAVNNPEWLKDLATALQGQ